MKIFGRKRKDPEPKVATEPKVAKNDEPYDNPINHFTFMCYQCRYFRPVKLKTEESTVIINDGITFTPCKESLGRCTDRLATPTPLILGNGIRCADHFRPSDNWRNEYLKDGV
jgi:hypothetical protein